MAKSNSSYINKLMGEATGFHSRGAVVEAAALYQQVLARKPNHAEANHLLGLTKHQRGDSEGGLVLMRRGIELKPGDAGYHSNCGSALKRLGRLEEALESFESALRIDSKFLPALYNAGEVYCSLNQLEEAEAAYRKASELRPDLPDIWSNLGTCLVQRENWEAAGEAFAKVLELDPNYAAAHFGLGHVFEQLGRLEEARRSYGEASRMGYARRDCLLRLMAIAQAEGRPERVVEHLEEIITTGDADAAVYNNLAIACQDVGEQTKAFEAIEQALAIDPFFATALCTKSNWLIDAGRFEEAVRVANKATFCDRQSDIAYNNLGTAYRGLARLEDAKEAYETAIGLNPRRAEIFNNLALALQRLGDYESMEQRYNQALELEPRYASCLSNFATALIEIGRISEAEALLRQAIGLDALLEAPWENLGRALYELGDFEGSKETYLAALEKNGGDAQTRVALAATQIANGEIDDETLFDYHRKAGAAVEAKVVREELDLADCVDRIGQRGKLRLGFMSADFKTHSVAYFLLPLFRELDRQRFELFCYSGVKRTDQVTDQFKSLADAWRLVIEQPEEVTAKRIKEDEIDILFDLSGFTAGNSLEVFARKPAPVQVTWLGYAHSTGLSRMDYRIVDEKTDPEGTTGNTETLVYLPETFLTYQAPEQTPDVAEPPSLAAGRVTFGSFNNIVKLNSASIALFASVLQSVDGSRLLLKSHQTKDAAIQERVWRSFEERGVRRERVQLMPRFHSIVDHLNSYSKIDVALDTYPYNGTTTTCEALAMGVPVVTLAGTRHAARVGCSLLGSVGLQDLVAREEASFAGVAKNIALDIDRRVELRSSLRQRLAGSPLGDARKFAANMEKAIEGMWARFAASVGARR